MTVTIYNSSRGPLVIKDMLTPHLRNAVSKMEREGSTSGEPYLTMKAELNSQERADRDAEFDRLKEAGQTPAAAAKAMAPQARTAAEALGESRQIANESAQEYISRTGIGGNNPPPYAVMIAEENAMLAIEVDKAIAEAEGLPEKISTELQHELAAAIDIKLRALATKVGQTHVAKTQRLKEEKDAYDVFFLSRGLAGKLTRVRNEVITKDGQYLDAVATARREAAAAEAKRLQDEADAKLARAAEHETAGDNTRAEVQIAGAQAAETVAGRHEDVAAAPQRELSRVSTSFGTSSVSAKLDWDFDRATVDLEALRHHFPAEAINAAIRAKTTAEAWKADNCADLNARTALKGVTFKRVVGARNSGR